MIQKANASLTPQAFAQMSEGLSQDYADMLGDWHRVCASIQSKLDALPARLQPLLRDGSLNARQESDTDVKNKDETVSKLTGELQSSQEEVAQLMQVRDKNQECIEALQTDVKNKDETVSKLTGELQSSQEEVVGLMKVR